MHQVCRRFEQVVKRNCRSKLTTWRRVKNSEEDYYYQIDRKRWPMNFVLDDPTNFMSNFEWLVLGLRDIVEHLELPHLNGKELKFIQSYKFPQTQSLKVILEHGKFTSSLDEILTKDTVEILTNSFPNLTKLEIEGNIRDISPIRNLSQLNELALYFREIAADGKQLSAIFRQLKLRKFAIYSRGFKNNLSDIEHCVTLEEVALCPSSTCQDLEFLTKLPKLRKFICINHLRFPHYYTFKLFGERVYGFYSVHEFVVMEVLIEFRFLQKLYVNNEHFIFDSHENYFPKLREIHFLRQDTNIKTSVLSAPRDLFDVIKIIDSLEILTLPYQWINTKLKLSKLLEFLAEKNRPKPLELRCWISGVACKATMPYDNSSKYLTVRIIDFPSRELPWSSLCEPCIEVDLKPLE